MHLHTDSFNLRDNQSSGNSTRPRKKLSEVFRTRRWTVHTWWWNWREGIGGHERGNWESWNLRDNQSCGSRTMRRKKLCEVLRTSGWIIYIWWWNWGRWTWGYTWGKWGCCSFIIGCRIYCFNITSNVFSWGCHSLLCTHFLGQEVKSLLYLVSCTSFQTFAYFNPLIATS